MQSLGQSDISLMRRAELDAVLRVINENLKITIPNLKLLEIGAGTGVQARVLSELGCDVTAIDLHNSNYSDERLFEIIDYDGKNIPFADSHFDVVFSSNVLEHVKDIASFQLEMQRVIKSEGYAIHVLPTPSWRIWTNFAYYFRFFFKAKANLNPPSAKQRTKATSYKTGSTRRWMHKLFPAPHGERGNSLTEVYYFSPFYWRRCFHRGGWHLAYSLRTGLFYTGHSVLGHLLGLGLRSRLGKFLGSSSNIYVLQKTGR